MSADPVPPASAPAATPECTCKAGCWDAISWGDCPVHDRPAATPEEPELDSPRSLEPELAALRARGGKRINDPRAPAATPETTWVNCEWCRQARHATADPLARCERHPLGYDRVAMPPARCCTSCGAYIGSSAEGGDGKCVNCYAPPAASPEPERCASTTGGGRYRCEFLAGHAGRHQASGVFNTWTDPAAPTGGEAGALESYERQLREAAERLEDVPASFALEALTAQATELAALRDQYLHDLRHVFEALDDMEVPAAFDFVQDRIAALSSEEPSDAR